MPGAPFSVVELIEWGLAVTDIAQHAPKLASREEPLVVCICDPLKKSGSLADGNRDSPAPSRSEAPCLTTISYALLFPEWCNHLRFDFFGRPTISLRSFLLSVNIPREKLPTVGAPISLWRFDSLLFDLGAFSKTTPFSLASLLLLVSLSALLASMPFRCARGMFF